MNHLGMNEVRWEGNGEFVSDDYVIMYSGGDKHKKGVDQRQNDQSYKQISHRMLDNVRQLY